MLTCISYKGHGNWNYNILSVIHYKIRGAMCFQFTHFPCDDWDNIYTLSYHHHQIGIMNYYPLFRVRLWNNGVRCMSFCILILLNRINQSTTKPCIMFGYMIRWGWRQDQYNGLPFEFYLKTSPTTNTTILNEKKSTRSWWPTWNLEATGGSLRFIRSLWNLTWGSSGDAH